LSGPSSQHRTTLKDFVEAFEDAGRYAGPFLVESTREIADQFFSLVGVIELAGLAQHPTGGRNDAFGRRSMMLRALWIWQRWIAAAEPKVRRIASTTLSRRRR